MVFGVLFVMEVFYVRFVGVGVGDGADGVTVFVWKRSFYPRLAVMVSVQIAHIPCISNA